MLILLSGCAKAYRPSGLLKPQALDPPQESCCRLDDIPRFDHSFLAALQRQPTTPRTYSDLPWHEYCSCRLRRYARMSSVALFPSPSTAPIPLTHAPYTSNQLFPTHTSTHNCATFSSSSTHAPIHLPLATTSTRIGGSRVATQVGPCGSGLARLTTTPPVYRHP